MTENKNDDVAKMSYEQARDEQALRRSNPAAKLHVRRMRRRLTLIHAGAASSC